MFEAHNRLVVESAEQARLLEERFAQASDHMSRVPGFVKFGMLRSQDGSHFIVVTRWETEQHFRDWVASPHFQAAHGRRSPEGQAQVGAYEVVYD